MLLVVPASIMRACTLIMVSDAHRPAGWEKDRLAARRARIHHDDVQFVLTLSALLTPIFTARPALFATRPVRRALLTSQAHTGSLYRCGR